MEFKHYSVLLSESVEALNVKSGGVYLDCSTGGGGHSAEIEKKIGESGKLICVDRDEDALKAAKLKLKRAEFIKGNFAEIVENFNKDSLIKFDGIIADLGVSNYQLENAERGFSFHNDAPLDMRMDRSAELDARFVVNNYSKEELARIIFKFGEEKFANGISSGIVKAREKAPIETTGELAEIIKRNVPIKIRNERNPARKTFQAIRIEVNSELDSLERLLKAVLIALKVGGRLAIISFHSIEDRIVKEALVEAARGCVCPPEFPICVCGREPSFKLINKKPIVPSEKELEENRASRSAKLRVIEKIK